jgi:hypothetical protein
MASLSPVVMCHSGQIYYECDCSVVQMTNGRYAFKAVQFGKPGCHVYKFTTKSNYDMYCYNLTRPPDEVECKSVRSKLPEELSVDSDSDEVECKLSVVDVDMLIADPTRWHWTQ